MSDDTVIPRKLLRTISYNIDGLHMTNSKFSMFIDTIETQKPDILCLTHVTEEVFNKLLQTLDSSYVSFQVFIEEEEDLGTVIMCNKETTAISEEEPPYYFDYPSGTPGRVIGTGIVLKKNKSKFNILTADIDHDNEDIRKIQFDILTKVINDIEDYIIMGDTGNLSLKGKGQGAKDVWTKLGCPFKIKTTDRMLRTYVDSKVLIPKAMSLIGIKTPMQGLETIFQINRKSRT